MSEIDCPICDYSGNMLGLSLHIQHCSEGDEEKYMKEIIISHASTVIDEDFDGQPPKIKTLVEHLPFSSKSFYKYFDGYDDFLIQSNYERRKVTKEELIEEIKRVSEKFCGGDTPNQQDIVENGKFSAKPYTTNFSSFNEALKIAGFDVNIHSNITKEEYINEIKRLSEKLGRKPKGSDMDKHGAYSCAIANKKFESWSDLVKKAGFEKPRNNFKSGEENYMYGKRGSDHPSYVDGEQKYKGDFRMKRQIALERADYECEHPNCNKTVNDDTIIDCHHIIPNSLTDDEFQHDLDNLLIVCRKHHLSNEEGVEPIEKAKRPMKKFS